MKTMFLCKRLDVIFLSCLAIWGIGITLCSDVSKGSTSKVKANFSDLRICPNSEKLILKAEGFISNDQIAHINFTLPFTVGENLQVVVTIMKENITLFTFKESDFCNTMKKYFGEMFGDMLQSVGLPSNTCPIPPGYYRMVYKIDMTKFAYPMLPIGDFIMNIESFQFKNKVSCHVVNINFETI